MSIDRYRLEVAIKKIRQVSGFKEDNPKTSVVIQFLDFPDIVIYPLGDARKHSGSTYDIRYTVSHKADFLLEDTLKQCVFPTQCFCTLAEFVGKSKARVIGKWSTQCSYVRGSEVGNPREYATLTIRNNVGEEIGTVEMCSRVIPSPIADRSSRDDTPLHRVADSVRSPQSPGPSHSHSRQSRFSDYGEPDGILNRPSPQKLRVVVRDNNNNNKHSSSPTNENNQQQMVDSPLAGAGRAGSHGGGSRDEKRTLLSLLRYDVVYQLKSTSETLASTLKREEDLLSTTPCTKSAHGILKLIDQRVLRVLKITNIVLQMTNRLSAEPTHGTARDVTAEVQQRFYRNPINNIKTPIERSVGYYLMYNVLFQLQCVMTHLSYLLEAYERELDIPLELTDRSTITYCIDFERHAHGLMKYCNILVQSAVDGRLGSGQLTRRDLDDSFSSGSEFSDDDVLPPSRHKRKNSLNKQRVSPKDKKGHKSSGKRVHHRSPSSSSSSSSSSSDTGSSRHRRSSSRRGKRHHHRSKHYDNSCSSIPADLSAVLPPPSGGFYSLRSSPMRPAPLSSSSSSSTMAPNGRPPSAPVVYQWNTTVTPPAGVSQTVSSAAPHVATKTVAGPPVRREDYSSDSDFSSSSGSSSRFTSPPISSRRPNDLRVLPVPQPAIPHYPGGGNSAIVKYPPMQGAPAPAYALAVPTAAPPSTTLGLVGVPVQPPSARAVMPPNQPTHGHHVVPVTVTAPSNPIGYLPYGNQRYDMI